MPTSPTSRAAQLRRQARTLRRIVEPFDGWPRDARAWARRDRIEALLTQMEATIEPTRDDPTRLLRVVEELRSWWVREVAFYRSYPIVPPAHWTSRPLPTSGSSARRRAQRVRRTMQRFGARA
jgi:hypothetical protein